MATRGIFQLQTLTLYYCEHGGSSQAVRDYLASGKLISWAKERPHLNINVKVRNGKHPFIQAEYLTNTNNNNNNTHQICIKSSKSNEPNIPKVLYQLYNRSGRKITKFTKPIYTDTPSIQGVWTPALNLHLSSKFPMEIVEK